MKSTTEKYINLTGNNPIKRIVGNDSGIDAEGSLLVWWVPQIPMESFLVPVENIDEAKKILDVLANYDLFQFENNVKPDYANAGGLLVFEDSEWIDWSNPQTGDSLEDMQGDDNE